MPRYYYACPIKALYMMKEFGVKIAQRDNYPELPMTTVDIPIKEMIDDILPYWNPRYEKENRLYVALESESIFEHEWGDILHYEFMGGSATHVVPQIPNKNWSKDVRNIRIIMRDNKHFLMPGVEE